MVARPGTYTASNNSGELAPELWGRTDIKQFFSGMSLALNVEPVPQGGSRLSPRSRFLGRVRNRLALLATSSVTIAVGPFTVAAVLATATFSLAQSVAVVALPAMTATVAIGALLQVEWQDVGSVWHSFGPAFAPPASAKTHTVALAPRQHVVAIAVRLRMVANPASSVTFTLPSIAAYAETSTLPSVRPRPFTFALNQTYMATITEDITDFWRDGAWVGAAIVALTTDQIKAIDAVQRLDTMMIFHPAVPSIRIMREGSDSNWRVDAVPFTNVPQVDYGATYTNQVTDEWQVYISYPTDGTFANGSGIFVQFTVNGNEAAAVEAGSDWSAFAAGVATAIEALPGVAAGITVGIASVQTGLTIMSINFTGAGNNGAPFLISAAVVNTGVAAATSTHIQIGVPGGEPLTSAARGYASAGAFYQDRLETGGFSSKPGAWLASVSSDYFNQDITGKSATAAILINLDTDGAEQIQRIVRSQFLLFFTSDAEYFISDRALAAGTPPNIVNSSRNGSAPNVPIVENEGAILYLSPDRSDPDRKGKLLYEASYDAITTKYVSNAISLLASHIVNAVTGMALQRGTTASDANRLWMTRADGSMTEGVMIRGQDITAFARWQTDGEVLDVAVDGLNRPHIAVQRVVAGAPEIHLEWLELGLLFDGTLEQTFGTPTAAIGGLDMHEGASVWALADGFVEGPFTVSGGQVVLPYAARDVLVGRWTPPDARLLPIPSDVANGIVVKTPVRVFAVRVDLVDTTSVAIGANGEVAADVPLYFAGGATDAPPAPVTGLVAAEGLVGYSDDGIVQITQVRPGALAWRSVTVESTRTAKGGT